MIPTPERIAELEEIGRRYDEEQYKARRLRIIDVAMQDVVTLFQINEASDTLLMGSFPHLPKDYKVISADFWFARHTLGLLIWSMEFSSVPLGQEIPRLGYAQPDHVRSQYRKVTDEKPTFGQLLASGGLTDPSSPSSILDSDSTRR